MSDSALDSILDQYSEDAKKAQKDYASQSKKDKNEKSNTKNPQLPTQDELKHKSKPAQSFNNDVNQKDTRATSLFETDPSISNNDDSGQFNVVDSKIHVNLSNQLLKMHIALVKITIFMRLS